MKPHDLMSHGVRAGPRMRSMSIFELLHQRSSRTADFVASVRARHVSDAVPSWFMYITTDPTRTRRSWARRLNRVPRVPAPEKVPPGSICVSTQYITSVVSTHPAMGQNLQPASVGSVKLRGGCIQQCSGSFWVASPILRNLAPSAIPFEVNCDEKTWKQLESVHRGEPFPTGLRDLYELLVVTVHLQLTELTRLCLKNLFRAPEFWRVHYPKYIPDEVVLMCFRESLIRLFRTEAVYQQEFYQDILCLSRGPKVEASATNKLNSMIAEYTGLELDRVPLRIWVPCVPVMIMKRQGKFQTALCHDESCEPVELFGKYFDLSRVNIDAFYLRYASYLLYKSGEGVYFENLRREAEVVPCLDHCKLLISKKDTVLAVTKENSENHIWMWIENQEEGRSFTDIYSTTEDIKSVDIRSSEIFLILKESGSLSTAERRNPGLVITDLGGGYSSAWFHDNALYAISIEEGRSDGFKLHRFERVSTAPWDKSIEFGERESLEEFAKGGRISSIGGKLFRLSENGLEIRSALSSPKLILNPEEYVASSELHLHP